MSLVGDYGAISEDEELVSNPTNNQITQKRQREESIRSPAPEPIPKKPKQEAIGTMMHQRLNLTFHKRP